VAGDLDSLLERLEARPAAADSLEAERLHRAVRARLLDETVPETRIDRFVITGRLGVGGMGVVYAAHDSQLDRKVAIKLVRHVDPSERERDQQRLLHEARSLAQLSHPNVVAIYDVGLHGDRVFIAMELVAGTTLRRWNDDGSRKWDEVLRCLAQAGEGLAAAHAAGIVHRDFKPDNVLVGEDGRVRVLDFGLAHGDGSVPTSAAQSGDAVISAALTATGKVVGTPAYMAPEQFAGAPADPRTDQFSFCVTCWEALLLERPYPATSTAQLRVMMAEGAIAKPKDPDRAPEWLRDVLARGLAADPDARWPSMRALLDACAPRRRRPWKIGALAAAGAVGLTLGGGALWQGQQRAACERDAKDGIAMWNAGAKASIVEAFAATGLVHGESSGERIGGLLDDYASAWALTHERGCLAHLGGAIDDGAWTRRRACLDDRRERLVTLVELLQAPDRDVVNNAVSVAYDLPLASSCEDDGRLAADAAALGSAVDPAQVTEVRRGIARAELLAEAVRPDAIEVASAARDRAALLGDPSLVAEADVAVGDAHRGRDENQAATEAYERAYFSAHRLGADAIALDAATKLVDTVGKGLARFDDGLEWSRHAEGLLARSGSARAWHEAELAERIAKVQREQADLVGARASFERAIALRTEVSGPDHPAVGHAWAELGGMLAIAGDSDEAERPLDEAERILAGAYGPEALQLVLVYSSRGAVARFRGDPQATVDHYAHALAIREAWLEPEHPTIAASLNNLAAARTSLGDFAGARDLFARVVELRRTSLGRHPSLATALNNLGLAEANLGDARAAVEHFGEALEIRRATLPPGHPDIAWSLVGLGDAFQQARDYRRAFASYDEAARMTEDASLAREHGAALTGRGMTLLGLREPAKAREDFEAALATPFAEQPDPTAQCGLRHGLVRAMIETEGDSERARQIAIEGERACRDLGVEDAETLADLAAWGRGETTVRPEP
jgi:tetratricopeptide (TPR) repeat protein/tRNA A-37 threonylcarbamoyl transferase component Bud32